MKLISLGLTNPASILSTSVIAIFLFSIISTNVLAQICVAPSPNIVAWWPFDETSGAESQDFSGINDGVHVGGPVPTPGIVGGSLRFDGIDDYVAAPDSDLWAFGTSDFTIEFWANFDVPGGGSIGHPGDVFISNDEGPFSVNKWFLALGAGALNFHVNGSSTGSFFSPQAPFSPIVGRWYHLAITRIGTNYSIFVDGALSRTGTNSANIANANSILTIGRALEPFGGFMNGRLDEMTIYDKALTEAELRTIFNAGNEGKCKSVTIDTQALSAIQLNTESSQQLQAIGGVSPYSWSVVSGTPPTGMNVSGTGVFSGTPTVLGSSTFTVQVTDNNGDTAETTFTVDVVLVLPPPAIQISKVGTIAVPGREIEYFIIVENKGSTTATDIEILELLDPLENFTDPSSTTPPVSTIRGNNLVWNIDLLNPRESKVLNYSVTISPTVQIGDLVKGQAFQLCDQAKQGDACRNIDLACKVFSPSIPNGIPTWFDIFANWFNANVPSKECTAFTLQCAEDSKRLCPSDSDDKNATGPIDPNEKLVAAKKFIQPDQTLVYPIHFENIGEVEAIDVFITDLLDPTLDDSTLQILSPNGTYDPTTRTLKWNLLGRNLLPGETDNVLLSIKPVPGLPSGTEIRNSAEIMFEVFAPLVTPEVVNIIDTTLPECVMDALPNQVMTTDFDISWSGTDAVGEIDTYSIFVSDNATDYTLFLETSDTSATFTGVVGTTYNFFCIAKDTAGNVEVESLFSEAKTTVTLGMGVKEVTIDIKPRSHRNRINPKSRGKIKVAILTTDTFDATTVDPSSVKFGPDGAPTRKRVKTKDVNKDGLDDFVLRFRTRETGIACDDTSASLTGKTFAGQAFTGSDSIKTVGCKKKKQHERGDDEDKDDRYDNEGTDDENEEED